MKTNNLKVGKELVKLIMMVKFIQFNPYKSKEEGKDQESIQCRDNSGSQFLERIYLIHPKLMRNF